MKTDYFENVKDQIGFCGIWCGSCAAGNGAIVELAKRFEELVEKYELENWVPKDFNFQEFMKGLTSIQAMPVCPGCKKNGGFLDCGIKKCASNKEVLDCSQCSQLMRCKNFELLEKTHPKIKEDLMRNSDKDQKELVERWVTELKTKWPHCVLFLHIH